MDFGRRLGDTQVASNRTAFLRETGLIKHGAAFAFQMRGHADQRTDRDHAGAADAGDENIPRLFECRRELRLRQCGKIHFTAALALLHTAAMDRDEAWAEALDARKILVAIALIDLALAAVFGFFR